MIMFVPFESIEQRHIVGLVNSAFAAPADNRMDLNQILKEIKDGTMRLFDWPHGIVLVSKNFNRLTIWALATNNLIKDGPQLTDDLKRLAAEWECDTIQTTCFDPRLTSVIQKLGGRVESTTLTLAVE